jgi:hypothetical protein
MILAGIIITIILIIAGWAAHNYMLDLEEESIEEARKKRIKDLYGR